MGRCVLASNGHADRLGSVGHESRVVLTCRLDGTCMILAQSVENVIRRQRIVALGKHLKVVIGLLVHLPDIATQAPVIAGQLVDGHQTGRSMIGDTYEVVVATGVYLDDYLYPVAQIVGLF